jgi:glycosyltransferase involved in cell wall biosynthesis
MTDHFAVSVAVPVFNEESLIPELLKRTLAVLDQIAGGPHELVLVDDGSSDRTFELLREAAQRDPRIVVVQLSRNFGHQPALTAALDHVRGDLIAMMDGDLQDPPEAILTMLERHRDGFEVVYAIRAGRKEGWFLRTCYRAFYRVIGAMSDLELPPDAGDFCLMTRTALNAMLSARERERYLRGLRAWVGFRQVGVTIERGVRHSGESKYTWRQLFRLAFDGIFAFSTVPIRLATGLGLLILTLTFLLGIFLVTAKILGYSPQGFTALATSIAFFAGVQLLFLGIIGEYVGRIYTEVKGRPLYVVRTIVRTSRRE